MTTQNQHVTAYLNKVRSALGTGETPPGSNKNFIVDWYNKNVFPIGIGPWCEMKNTWGMWISGAKALKTGQSYTPYAAGDAQKGKNGSSWHWGTKGMRAGDDVYYDWSGSASNIDAIDHTGTVEYIHDNGTFDVLEGNHNDKLQRVTRDSKYVVGYVRYDWSRLIDFPQIPEAEKAHDLLVIDGELGPLTIKAWQRVMKTPVDGVIDKTQSDLIKAVQRKLNATVGHGLDRDGELGPETIKALQRYLRVPITGIIAKPKSDVVKQLQRRLNEGRF